MQIMFRLVLATIVSIPQLCILYKQYHNSLFRTDEIEQK